MPADRLSDSEGKALLRKWPSVTSKWSVREGGSRWLRAQPIPHPRPSFRSPWLSVPGAGLFSSQPDGLWVSFPARTFCDLIAVEVCGSVQNLNDKRSRYMHTSYSLLLNCKLEWLEEEVTWKRSLVKRWELARLKKPTIKLRRFPVRFITTLFALPNDNYASFCAENPPAAHEYYIPHSSLGSFTSQPMQRFKPYVYHVALLQGRVAPSLIFIAAMRCF